MEFLWGNHVFKCIVSLIVLKHTYPIFSILLLGMKQTARLYQQYSSGYHEGIRTVSQAAESAQMDIQMRARLMQHLSASQPRKLETSSQSGSPPLSPESHAQQFWSPPSSPPQIHPGFRVASRLSHPESQLYVQTTMPTIRYPQQHMASTSQSGQSSVPNGHLSSFSPAVGLLQRIPSQASATPSQGPHGHPTVQAGPQVVDENNNTISQAVLSTTTLWRPW